MDHRPFILPFAGVEPTFAGPIRFAGNNATVLGRATIGADAFLGADSVVRADGEVVGIGDGVFLGPRATVHIVHELLPCRIGRNVTVGANTVVHACTVGDDCVIEHDVVVLDDAKVAPGVLIEAGATVFPRKTLDAGWIYAGSPAKPVRELKPGELAQRAAAVRARHAPDTEEGDMAGTHRSDPAGAVEEGAEVFVAHTARVDGRVRMAPGASLFFSCIAEAGTGTVSVGANTNVQDNCIIRTGGGETSIGREVTVGHNVTIGAARVGSRTLIGMGVRLLDGVVVEDDVLLAAGATTEPGQVLGSGWLWGGRPAKPMSRLDDARRAGMAENVAQYCEYARTFRRLQAEAALR